ncbi:isoaspartyl peptidase/L-asparaginase-like [Lytechinus variegatus]|uniref:isoaspartyl peptidase/L-asparaginase-like n=1 Tax=Lytechinus variegatus TaxID=7654 RepID=UPI001BB1E730|nr:isoaspartyl peptidase/L-asparaginase-like [Lytechinus variegatus]
MASEVTPVIIVHGGAGDIAEGREGAVYPGIQEAAREGYKILQDGTALDAVERAVCCLEDNPQFNAGYGSKLNAAGELEMDAIVMEGKSLKSGAVSCVRDIKNPIKLARTVLEKTEHDFLIGKGLEAFIDEHGLTRTPPSELISERAINLLESMKGTDYLSEVKREVRKQTEHDTVGAVALDRFGNIACGTSTGGLTGQRVGRVGDSPLIGCGAYCDNAVGGVSTTGIGEAIMRIAMAARIILYMEHGMTGEAAAKKALEMMKERTGYKSGAIVLGADGQPSPVFTTSGLPWASVKNGRISYGVRKGDILDGGSM